VVPVLHIGYTRIKLDADEAQARYSHDGVRKNWRALPKINNSPENLPQHNIVIVNSDTSFRFPSFLVDIDRQQHQPISPSTTQ
jgi:hypothetical protein